jgi:hypothetical protein
LIIDHFISANDWILTGSNTSPFLTGGNFGYAIQNGGTPVVYTFITQGIGTVPLYRLVANILPVSAVTVAHIAVPNQTAINIQYGNSLLSYVGEDNSADVPNGLLVIQLYSEISNIFIFRDMLQCRCPPFCYDLILNKYSSVCETSYLS